MIKVPFSTVETVGAMKETGGRKERRGTGSEMPAAQPGGWKWTGPGSPEKLEPRAQVGTVTPRGVFQPPVGVQQGPRQMPGLGAKGCAGGGQAQ